MGINSSKVLSFWQRIAIYPESFKEHETLVKVIRFILVIISLGIFVVYIWYQRNHVSLKERVADLNDTEPLVEEKPDEETDKDLCAVVMELKYEDGCKFIDTLPDATLEEMIPKLHDKFLRGYLLQDTSFSLAFALIIKMAIRIRRNDKVIAACKSIREDLSKISSLDKKQVIVELKKFISALPEDVRQIAEAGHKQDMHEYFFSLDYLLQENSGDIVTHLQSMDFTLELLKSYEFLSEERLRTLLEIDSKWHEKLPSTKS